MRKVRKGSAYRPEVNFLLAVGSFKWVMLSWGKSLPEEKCESCSLLPTFSCAVRVPWKEMGVGAPFVYLAFG